MHSIRFAISILLVGAIQAAAQGKDSANSKAHQASDPQSIAAMTASSPGNDDLTPRCWLGCRGTLTTQRNTPAERGMSGHGRMDTVVALLYRRPKPIASADVQQARLAAARAASPTARGVAADRAGAAAPTSSAATEVDAERFLIEEWRRSELEIADSIHHDVLARISRIYDSAQRPSVSADARLHVVQQVDGINAVNQLMWLERRRDVNREADSAILAIPRSSRAP